MLHGVNLGGWLALEKWMSPALFEGTSAMDETYLCQELGAERARERLKTFRDTFITARDFADIAAKGFNAVRIPVPFFLFEDIGPYIHCYEYLDRAFDWAEKYGLKVLIDLHTVPGGHNGTDNSGICGISLWSTRQECVEYTLAVLERLAQRYGGRSALWGIEALNEPMCGDTEAGKYLNIHNFVNFYVPVDTELSRDNATYSLAFLKDFYRSAYRRMRKHMGADKYVVLSDAFELDIWDDFLSEEGFEGICLDTHHYLQTPDRMTFTKRNVEVYREYLQALGKRLRAVGKRLPLIVGEWNAQNTADGLADMPKDERDALYATITDEFLNGMTECLGWFYWSYKVLGEGLDAECDDAGRCVDNGWLKPRNDENDKEQMKVI